MKRFLLLFILFGACSAVPESADADVKLTNALNEARSRLGNLTGFSGFSTKRALETSALRQEISSEVYFSGTKLKTVDVNLSDGLVSVNGENLDLNKEIVFMKTSELNLVKHDTITLDFKDISGNAVDHKLLIDTCGFTKMYEEILIKSEIWYVNTRVWSSEILPADPKSFALIKEEPDKLFVVPVQKDPTDNKYIIRSFEGQVLYRIQ